MRLVASCAIIRHSVCHLIITSKVLVDVVKLSGSLLRVWNYRIIIERCHLDCASLA